MKKTQKFIALVLAIALIASLAVTASAETVLEKIKTSGKLVVGTEATYAPYEFLDD